MSEWMNFLLMCSNFLTQWPLKYLFLYEFFYLKARKERGDQRYPIHLLALTMSTWIGGQAEAESQYLTQPKYFTLVAGPSLLPPKVYTGRKLESGDGDGDWTEHKHPSVGWEYPKEGLYWYLSGWARSHPWFSLWMLRFKQGFEKHFLYWGHGENAINQKKKKRKTMYLKT